MGINLDKAIDSINKKYGDGSLMKMDGSKVIAIDAIPSGSISMDIATGVGGYPRGRIVEIYGQESSGKTTMALHAIAEAQKGGGIGALVDAEHAFDPTYATNLGIDINELLISQPNNGEQALDIVEALVSSGEVTVVVVDSVAALTPQSEINGEMGDSNMGVQARLMSQAMRKLVGVVHKSNTTLIFINQLRDKIGVMFGNPETTTGGNALKFYASMRVEVKRVAVPSKDKDGDAVSNRTKVRIVKNKVAIPFKKAEFDIVYGRGISRVGEIVDIGVDMDIIHKSGSWYSYNDSKLGQGRDAVISLLLSDQDLSEELSIVITGKLSEK